MKKKKKKPTGISLLYKNVLEITFSQCWINEMHNQNKIKLFSKVIL